MKNLLKIILLVAVMSLAGFARQSFAAPACLLTLEWQPSLDSGIAGYTLYYGATGTPLTNRVDVGPQTTAAVKGLTASVGYTFYVVAYDFGQNEGVPSSALLYTASSISSLKLSQSSSGAMNLSLHVAPGGTCRLEYTDSLTPPNWNLLTAATGDSNGLVVIDDPVVAPGGSRFYRGVAQ